MHACRTRLLRRRPNEVNKVVAHAALLHTNTFTHSSPHFLSMRTTRSAGSASLVRPLSPSKLQSGSPKSTKQTKARASAPKKENQPAKRARQPEPSSSPEPEPERAAVEPERDDSDTDCDEPGELGASRLARL